MPRNAGILNTIAVDDESCQLSLYTRDEESAALLSQQLGYMLFEVRLMGAVPVELSQLVRKVCHSEEKLPFTYISIDLVRNAKLRSSFIGQ